MAVKLSALRLGRPLLPRKIPDTIYIGDGVTVDIREQDAPSIYIGDGVTVDIREQDAPCIPFDFSTDHDSLHESE
jgi:sRNA-binding carbon storage regulator CsrA